MEMKPKVTIILNKKVSEVSESCPTATTDIEENAKNRNTFYGGYYFLLQTRVKWKL